MPPILPAGASGPCTPTGARRRPRVVGCRCSRRRPPTSTTSSPPPSATARLPSVAAGLVRGGELVWSGAAGHRRRACRRARRRTPTRSTGWGRSRRPSSPSCVLRLRDAGRLDLSDRFEDHVPGSPLDDVDASSSSSPTPAGSRPRRPGPWWERTPGGDWEALVAAAGRSSGSAPGGGSTTPTSGMPRLGRLLEVHHGRGWFDVVREELLEPLGMPRTTPRPTGPAAPGLAVHPFADVLLPEPEHDAGAMAPGGAAVDDRRPTSPGGRASSAVDTAGLLSADTLAEMVEPHHVVDEPGQPWVAAHGLGFQVWNVGGRAVRRARRLDAGLPRRLGSGWMPVCRGGSRRRGGHGIRPAGTASSCSTNTTASHGDRRPHATTCSRARASTSRGRRSSRGPRAATRPARARRHVALGPGDADRPGRRRAPRARRAGSGARLTLPAGRPPTSGWDWTATSPVSRCASCAAATARSRTWTSRRSGSRRTPYDPEADVPGGVDEAGWA